MVACPRLNVWGLANRAQVNRFVIKASFISASRREIEETMSRDQLVVADAYKSDHLNAVCNYHLRNK